MRVPREMAHFWAETQKVRDEPGASFFFFFFWPLSKKTVNK